MWLVFILVILGIIVFSLDVQIVFNKLLIKKEKIEFNSKIVFRIFRVFPVFSIKLNSSGIKIFKKEISYKKILENKEIKKLEDKMKFLDKKQMLDFLKILKIEKIDFCLKIGVLNGFITNVMVVIFSSIMPILFNLKFKSIDFQKANYKVFPEFNEDKFEYNGKIALQIASKDALKYIFENSSSFNVLKSLPKNLRKLSAINNKQKLKEKVI